MIMNNTYDIIMNALEYDIMTDIITKRALIL